MPFTPRLISNPTADPNAFQNQLYDLVRALERQVLSIYSDDLGVPTLGVGYALVVKTRQNPDRTSVWALHDHIDTDPQIVGINPSPQ